jgi:hypothetical protein
VGRGRILRIWVSGREFASRAGVVPVWFECLWVWMSGSEKNPVVERAGEFVREVISRGEEERIRSTR